MDDYSHEIPEGLGFSMAMNEKAMSNFGRMTEEEKRAVIEESRLVTSKNEMEKLVNRIANPLI